MLACFGMISADSTSLFPRVFEKFSSNPLQALSQCPKLGWLQILTFTMFIEVLGIINSRRPDYEPGNFLGTSQWGLEAGNDFGWDSYQTKELNNGRLAMFGAIGMLAGSYITGKGPLEFNQPNGICVDAARRHILIADRENNRVQCVDATTLRPVWTHASTGGTLNYPNFCAMSVDNALVFVTDGWSNRVATLDATGGKFVASCGSRGEGASQFDAPQGVAVSPVDGHVWIADHSNHRVSIFDASVQPWRSLGQIGSTGVDGDSNAMLSSPHGLAIAGGRVYVCDQGNHRVQVFDATTRAHVRTITGAPASPLQSPTGICVLGNALYVCDRDNARVSVFNATSGAFRGVCGSSDSRDDSGAPLFSPFVFHTGVYAVCADAARQEILVTDAGTNRISVFAAHA